MRRIARRSARSVIGQSPEYARSASFPSQIHGRLAIMAGMVNNDESNRVACKRECARQAR